jgi:signal transduction histidine kinase/HD-like signal output (HDOD) protein
MAGSGLQRRKIEVLLDKVDQLPTLPGVARHLLSLLLTDHADRRDIQFAVEADAALSAKVVRMAVELGHPAASVTSIEAAFDAVPLDVLTADLLSLEVLDDGIRRDLGLTRLWRHSLAAGMAAQILASRLGTVRPEACLLAGILHDIGQIALATLMPRAYGQVLESAEAGGTDLAAAEREILGIDHAVFGKHLAQRWGFSEDLQNVIWLHHQAQVPVTDRPGSGKLAQVVRLADLIVVQEGFGFRASEPSPGGIAEAAERLGLSSASAEQVGRQVASAFAMNAQPVGLEDEPPLAELWPLISAANARLGRIHRTACLGLGRLEAQTRRADLLIRLGDGLSRCRTTREVLETASRSAHDALGITVVAAYVVGREADYVEGIRCSQEGAAEEHFLYALKEGEGLDALSPPLRPAGAEAAPSASLGAGAEPILGVPVRAERQEGWLFERLGPRVGPGPFYTIAMSAEERKVGGLVYSLREGGHTLSTQESSELAALASMAGAALGRVQAEADLVSLSEELAEANRTLAATEENRLRRENVTSMSEMAAGAAHEINNPLAIISGRAQQLADDEAAPERRQALQTIIQQADRISEIISELRLLACPPAPGFQTVDAAALAREAAAEFQAAGAAPAVRVEVEAPQAPVPVRVDPKQLTATLKELIRNAVAACSGQEGATVRVAVQPVPAQGAVRVVVADNGPGMDAKVRARAFDPFYTGREAGRRKGLGLPRAYRTIQVNGGQMSLESAPGRGTTVRVVLRAAEPPATA